MALKNFIEIVGLFFNLLFCLILRVPFYTTSVFIGSFMQVFGNYMDYDRINSTVNISSHICGVGMKEKCFVFWQLLFYFDDTFREFN